MENYDWSRFITRISVKADPGRLYAAWATRAGIESWFLRLGEFTNGNGELLSSQQPVQPGDKYRWQWFGYPDEVTEKDEIIEANGKDRVKFGFGAAGKCTVTIFEELGETIVQLAQEDIPTDDYGKHHWHLGCKTGWTFYLANLKSIMEGGPDLRNKNDKLERMIN